MIDIKKTLKKIGESVSSLDGRTEAVENDITNIKTNKVLWQGAGMFVNGEQTANLAEPVSEQTNGIVLVWGHYDSANNNYNSTYNVCCSFIPKWIATESEGKGYNCTLSTSGGEVLNKYVYVYDSKIVGHQDNGSSSPNRKFFVLYAILGV